MVNPDSISAIAVEEERILENNSLNPSLEWLISNLYQHVTGNHLPWNWNELYFNGDAEVVANIRAMFEICMLADFPFIE
jgi:hypothetical protein